MRVPNQRSTSVATITGQRASSILPDRDTPRDADGFSPRRDGLPCASGPAELARAAWRSVTPRLAGTPHVRVSRDGGRTFPARHARPLPAEPPGQPCTVPVYDPGSATGQMLALDGPPGPSAGAPPGIHRLSRQQCCPLLVSSKSELYSPRHAEGPQLGGPSTTPEHSSSESCDWAPT